MNSEKFSSAIGTSTIILCLCFGCHKNLPGDANSRPDGFPVFLKAPQNAREISYTTPETDEYTYGVYSLTYIVDEDHPAPQTAAFVSDMICTAGFLSSDYDLYEPERKQTDQWHPNRDLIPGHIVLEHTEYWIHPQKEEYVSALFLYQYKIDQEDLTTLHVNIQYHTENAPTSALAARYKQRHSEGFKPIP